MSIENICAYFWEQISVMLKKTNENEDTFKDDTILWCHTWWWAKCKWGFCHFFVCIHKRLEFVFLLQLLNNLVFYISFYIHATSSVSLLSSIWIIKYFIKRRHTFKNGRTTFGVTANIFGVVVQLHTQCQWMWKKY